MRNYLKLPPVLLVVFLIFIGSFQGGNYKRIMGFYWKSLKSFKRVYSKNKIKNRPFQNKKYIFKIVFTEIAFSTFLKVPFKNTILFYFILFLILLSKKRHFQNSSIKKYFLKISLIIRKILFKNCSHQNTFSKLLSYKLHFQTCHFKK